MSPNLYSNIIPANKVKIRMMTCIINILVILFSILPAISIHKVKQNTVPSASARSAIILKNSNPLVKDFTFHDLLNFNEPPSFTKFHSET